MEVYRQTTRVTLRVNGRDVEVTLQAGDTLLRTLRENIGLTGTKMGCENGDCGACTVLLDGRPVKSCYLLALDALGREITTIEGQKDSAVQEAFVEEYGFQCGFCTPGMILNAQALIDAFPELDDEVTREWMESNLCRCTGYETIEGALRRAAGGRTES